MKFPKEELAAILLQYNPWWRKETIPHLPTWHRRAFAELLLWIETPPARRAVLLSGLRQIGKTTLLLQAIHTLVQKGIAPGNILYATFDHPICKLAGIDAVLEVWRELEPKSAGKEYLFLDEAQFIENIGTWIKHQVDFTPAQQIILTGSATPLFQVDAESGVGRWHTIRLSTLSFYEYLCIKNIPIPSIPTLSSLADLFPLTQKELSWMRHVTLPLIGHFHEYLLRGGFPQTALIENISQSQQLLREDIVDKVLKRDMTSLFGVRRIQELEQLFLYLCLHDGGRQDIQTLAKELGISKPTLQNFLALLESAHLVYKLPLFGYGKEVLRGKHKFYLTDPAIALAVFLKGKNLLKDPVSLGRCVETAVIGNIWPLAISQGARCSYWRGQKEKEVDLLLDLRGEVFPIEVKYQSQKVTPRDLAGLFEFCRDRPSVSRGYVLTKNKEDLGTLQENILCIPAPLFCFLLGNI